jgi:nucleoside-diphosphate-sugar epimerase
MTMLQFAEKIRALCGSASPIVRAPLPQDDPKLRRPDIAKARALLGWAPAMDLDEGLRRTIDYFRSLIQQGKL